MQTACITLTLNTAPITEMITEPMCRSGLRPSLHFRLEQESESIF